MYSITLRCAGIRSPANTPYRWILERRITSLKHAYSSVILGALTKSVPMRMIHSSEPCLGIKVRNAERLAEDLLYCFLPHTPINKVSNLGRVQEVLYARY